MPRKNGQSLLASVADADAVLRVTFALLEDPIVYRFCCGFAWIGLSLG